MLTILYTALAPCPAIASIVARRRAAAAAPQAGGGTEALREEEAEEGPRLPYEPHSRRTSDTHNDFGPCQIGCCSAASLALVGPPLLLVLALVLALPEEGGGAPRAVAPP